MCDLESMLRVQYEIIGDGSLYNFSFAAYDSFATRPP